MEKDKAAEKDETRYYDEVFQRLRNQSTETSPELEIENESDVLYDNVIEELTSNEAEVKKCFKSYHADYFIYKSKPKHFVQLFQLLTQNKQNLDEFISNPKISRACEACLLMIGEKIENTPDNNEKYIQGMKNIGDYLEENFEKILDNNISIYILRSFIRVIGDEDPFDAFSNKDKSVTNKKKPRQGDEFNMKAVKPKLVPDEWKIHKYLKKFATCVAKLSNILDFSLVSYSSPCITLLMRKLALKYNKSSLELVDLIHTSLSKKVSAFHSMIQDAIGSRFIETFLYCAPNELKGSYINEHMVANIVSYSKHIYANYVLQTLLKSMENCEQLQQLYDTLLDNLDSIIDVRTNDLLYKHFILIELIECCKKNDFSLQKLMKKLMKFFGCYEKENRVHFIRLLLIFEKYENVTKECGVTEALYNFDMKPNGCTLAGKLLEQKEENIVNGFQDLNSNELEHLCTHNVGSHFIQEALINFNNKKQMDNLSKIFDKLKGRFMIISSSKSGSYVMETLWSFASLKQRIDICEELKDVENELKRDQFARFFVYKIGLNFYRRKPAEWKNIQNSEFKKRKMFGDMLYNEDAQQPANGSQKRKQQQEQQGSQQQKKLK